MPIASESEIKKALPLPSVPPLANIAAAMFSVPNPVDASKGFVRPHRDAVVHVKGTERCPVTILRPDHADFHARQPGVIDAVRCSACRKDFPAQEFVWHGTDERVGT
jgi:hypothetical protein